MNDLLPAPSPTESNASSVASIPDDTTPAAQPRVSLNYAPASRRLPIGVYMRVSTDDQSHESQKGELIGWLRANGHDPERCTWFVDTATGKTTERMGLNALCGAVASGMLETVVVQRLDRLSRRLLDGLTLLAGWADRGVRIVSVRQQIDMSGAVGKMVAAMFLGVAEMELEIRRERQMAGIAVAKAKGVYKGRALGTFKASEARARALRASGATYREVGQCLGVSADTVRRYLGKKRRVYGSPARAGKSKDPEISLPPGDRPAT